MKYTFEITICGCATNCGHCYVDGGPGPAMSYEDYVLCLSKLAPALEKLNGEISLNLGNETFCHPRVAELFRLTDRVCPQFFDRRGRTFQPPELPFSGIGIGKTSCANWNAKALTSCFLPSMAANMPMTVWCSVPIGSTSCLKRQIFLSAEDFRCAFR